MKIAIHNFHLENMFTERWIEYCIQNDVPYKVVNCYDTDIVNQLQDCDALMWHHNETTYQDKLFAKQLLFSVQHAGKYVFPDFNTGWHFDDKLGQKYLLESIHAPYVKTYAFFDKETATEWAMKATFPKVFKLRSGSGSRHVQLITSKKQAIKKINQAFGSGFSQFNRIAFLKEQLRIYREGRNSRKNIINAVGRLILPPEFANIFAPEKGYLLFQEFIANNDYDIRVIVTGEKAFAVKRLVRKNDFRASGSGNKRYEKAEIDIRCIETAFKVNKKISSQSIAFDFVFDSNNTPLIVEISYGYAVNFYDPCPGYWDNKLTWHEGTFIPQYWHVENLVKMIKMSNEG